jgi:hypothetical protein
MTAAFPTLEAYLRQVPNGFDSFPACSIKASVIRDALNSKPLDDDPRLPAPIRAFVQSPPPVSSLVPEVLSNAILLTMYDVHFGALGRRAAWDWMHATTYKLLRAPLYRILFAVMSPERLLTGVAQRWSAFRRGTELSITDKKDGFARLKLVFPVALHTDLTLYLLSSAFQAAIDCSGAREASVEVEARSASEAVFACRWSR